MSRLNRETKRFGAEPAEGLLYFDSTNPQDRATDQIQTERKTPRFRWTHTTIVKE